MQSSMRLVASAKPRSTWEFCACNKPVSFPWAIPISLSNCWPTKRHQRRKQSMERSACHLAHWCLVFGNIIRRLESVLEEAKASLRPSPAHPGLSGNPGSSDVGGADWYQEVWDVIE